MPAKRAAKPPVDVPPAQPLAALAASASTDETLVRYLADRIAVLEGRIVSLESRLAMVECKQAGEPSWPPRPPWYKPSRPDPALAWIGKASDDYLGDNEK